MPNQQNAPAQVYSGAHFMIEVDGLAPKGALPTLRSVDGGGVKAEVVNYQMGENGDIWRQLGKPKYDDIKLSLGIADAGPFWTWIVQFLAGTHNRYNGAIIAADVFYKERARREFTDALLAEVGIGKWDANDKNQANVSITMAPEKVTFKPGNPDGGAKVDARASSEDAQKQVAACNFRFSVDGFEDACKRTNKVDAISLKCKIIEYHHGTRIEAGKMPGKIELGNLVFYVPEADAEKFRTIHNDRMAGTRTDQGKGLGAQLTFFNNNNVDQGQFQFKGVHIFNVSSEKADASSEEMKLTKIECVVEKIEYEPMGKLK